MTRLLLRPIVPILALLAVGGTQRRAQPSAAPQQPRPALTVFDPNPNHIWNRTYACLFVRSGPDGTDYGADSPDPLLWAETRHLLTGDSHRRALTCLDEFLGSRAEHLIQDPAERAVLQHDLWAVFDWVNLGVDLPRERLELEIRLAAAIRRLALTSEQVRRLPDNYAAAEAARQFAQIYAPHNPREPFLPPDLFRPDGPWICLSAFSDKPTALSHFTGRSRFLVFMRLPGGRDATLAYLHGLRASSEPPLLLDRSSMPVLLNLALPQFPIGTQLALVRQAIIIDDKGGLEPTALTESVQLRVYHDITPGRQARNFINGPSSHDQDFFEFRMSRPELFARGSGSLVAVLPGEMEYPTFSTHGTDAFESTSSIDGRSVVLERCRSCHSDSGIHSVQSRLQWMKHSRRAGERGYDRLHGDPMTWETEVTIASKQHQSAFELLQRLWRRARD